MKEVLAFQMNPEGDRRDIYHIIRESEVNIGKLTILNIWDPIPMILPNADGVILSGSALTIGEPMSLVLRARSEIVAYNALALIAKNVPVLGICYGAQIVAQELWSGSVQSNGKWNIGRTKIIPTQLGSVISSLEPMKITVSYKEKIVGIPDQNILALGADSEILAYKFGSFIGLLGHPEIPVNIIQNLISQRRNDSRYSKINILGLSEDEESSLPSSIRIIQNFLNL